EYAGGQVEEWLEKLLQKRLGNKPLFASEHCVSLLVDGVNEVQANLYGIFMEGWRSLLQNQRSTRIIFTSRAGEDPSSRFGLSHVLTVYDLDDTGVKEFLQVYGREKAALEKKPYASEQVWRDFSELQSKNLLGEKGIGRNPYWLKMIAESGLYTRNRGVLFHTFAKKLLSREIDKKPKEPTREHDWKDELFKIEMDVLGNLALAMHKEKRIGFTDKEGWEKGWEIIEESLRYSGYKPEYILGDAQAATLIKRRYNERIEFIHQLVQEFFVAYALRSEAKWQEAISYCEDIWWWQTLFLLGGLIGADGADKSLEAYSQFVQKVLGDGLNDRRLFAAVGLLRSVENPLKENPVKDVSTEVSKIFANSVGERLTSNQVFAARELERILGDEAAKAFSVM
ncbi:MAG: NACHT domain-containing protein, partial [bacterium]